jgi:hypothetical protein
MLPNRRHSETHHLKKTGRQKNEHGHLTGQNASTIVLDRVAFHAAPVLILRVPFNFPHPPRERGANRGKKQVGGNFLYCHLLCVFSICASAQARAKTMIAVSISRSGKSFQI